ncbi:RES family NAD+ phosphorylase [Acidovorax sp. Leaf84]|uniref:RES family NAD+ phosphorylase n=1 Tax=Acidovorax sp. Leaf84 TaxID=1736240 RepID=UPI0009EAD962|nr:RES family NAD+ phosphorylase [Acidovorax sp. Leaf84]
MKLADLQYIPQFDLLAPQLLFRVQHSSARPGTVKIGTRLLLLPPSNLLSGRFDIAGQPVAYFAERPETALYEAICRREAVGISYALMAKRSLLSVQTTDNLPLLDLRPHTSSWPVLHSLRFDQTQALAAEAHAAGFLGIVYKSAQQYHKDCFALWGQALTALRRMSIESLVESGSGNLHVALATALNGSRLPLLP